MFRNSHLFGQWSSYAGRAVPRWRSSYLAVVLVLCLGIVGQTAPAQAAPHADKTTYEIRMRTTALAAPICPNSRYPVKVIVSVDRFANVGGADLDLVGGLGPSDISLTASIRDSSVAVVEPGELKLRALDAGIASGGARFTLYAKKAGNTTLIFQPTVNNAVNSGTDLNMPPLEVPIKVSETCKYRISMIWQWQVTSHGTVSLATGWLDTVLTLEDGVYKGEGFLDTVEARLMPPCSGAHSGFQSPTTITGVLMGSPGDEKLQLTFRYQPGKTTFDATCPMFSASSQGSEDPTNFLVGSAAFPKEGGSQSFPFEYGHGAGTMTVRVIPVDFSY